MFKISSGASTSDRCKHCSAFSVGTRTGCHNQVSSSCAQPCVLAIGNAKTRFVLEWWVAYRSHVRQWSKPEGTFDIFSNVNSFQTFFLSSHPRVWTDRIPCLLAKPGLLLKSKMLSKCAYGCRVAKKSHFRSNQNRMNAFHTVCIFMRNGLQATT
jgi:hypothetical protein